MGAFTLTHPSCHWTNLGKSISESLFFRDGRDDAEDDEPYGVDAGKRKYTINAIFVRQCHLSPQSVPGTGDDDKKEGTEMTMAEKKEAERLRYENDVGLLVRFYMCVTFTYLPI